MLRMDIVSYNILEEGEIITFRRRFIDESGKMNCCYSLSERKSNGELIFGIANENYSQFVGIPVKNNYEGIVSHLERIINTGFVKVFYKYIPAPPESNGNGTVCEIIPTLIESERKLPQKVINELKKILILIKNSKSVDFWFNDIKKQILKDIPIVIVGNKSDLVDEIVISEDDIRTIAKEFGFHYILTSAKTGVGVNDAFLYVAYRVIETL